jgi:lysophospholipase L1-like esterase
MDTIKALLQNDKPIRWLFNGDSITHGVVYTWGARDYTELFAERIRYELDRKMDMVINSAVDGDTCKGILDTFDWRVTSFAPDVAFVMIGMNDCANPHDQAIDGFEANLNTLADRIAQIDCHLILQTTLTVHPGGSPAHEPNINAYMQKVRDVASSRQLPLIDHTRYWQQNEERAIFWRGDAFHPNQYGHIAFAKLIFQSLDIQDTTDDPKARTCRLFIP